MPLESNVFSGPVAPATRQQGDLWYDQTLHRYNAYSNGRWLPIYNVYDVQALGAVGDGKVDDTAAILNAINLSQGNGTCYFPPGTYKITSTLSIDGSKGKLHLRGCGWTSVLSATAAVGNNPILLITDMTDSILEGFKIDGVLNTNPTCRGLQLTVPGIGEQSTHNILSNLWVSFTTDYNIYIDGHEDTYLFGVRCQVNNHHRPCLYYNIPGGAAAIYGSLMPGIVNLRYQQFLIDGGTFGPIRINNPGGSNSFTLQINGAYVYDSDTNDCISSVDTLTNLLINGSYLVNANNPEWIKGALGTNHVRVNSTYFVQVDPNANTTVNAVNITSGSGGVIVDGCAASLLNAVTGNVFTGPLPNCIAPSVNRNLTPPDRSLAAVQPVIAFGSAVQNAQPFDVLVSVYAAGSVTKIEVGPTSGSLTDARVTSGIVPVQAGGYIKLTGSGASWAWFYA